MLRLFKLRNCLPALAKRGVPKAASLLLLQRVALQMEEQESANQVLMDVVHVLVRAREIQSLNVNALIRHTFEHVCEITPQRQAFFPLEVACCGYMVRKLL